ncbi:helix-turn-helix domain-containing protein [Yoonia sp.]|uniref:helix-turn-helix domain-containing protein n=1 Tax=Yoonia sp. TaxID=2212373 RepID=UPI00391A39D6
MALHFPAMTAAQRANLISALRRTNGKVAGKDGAAQLLGMQPTTLYSRIRKMQISAHLRSHECKHSLPGSGWMARVAFSTTSSSSGYRER